MAVYKDKATHKYYYQFTIEGILYKQGSFRVRMDACIAEGFRRQALISGTEQKKNITFYKLLDNYYQNIKLKLKKTSFITYKYLIDSHIKPYIPNIDINELDFKILNDWKFKMLKRLKHVSILHKNKLIKLLKYILNYGNIFFDCPNVSFKKLELIKDDTLSKEVEVWSVEDFNKFIATFQKSTVYKLFFIVLFFTGLRLGEIQALQIEDYSYENKTLNVNKTLCTKSGLGHYVFTTPKTKNANRVVYLDDVTNDNINNYLGTRTKGFIFLNKKKYLSATNITRIKNAHCKLAGVLQIKLHDFRHSHITMLRSLGVDAISIGKRIGHSKTSITYHYMHTSLEEQKSIAKLLKSTILDK
jgi:integrase